MRCPHDKPVLQNCINVEAKLYTAGPGPYQIVLQWDTMDLWVLTHNELEIHGWEISTVSTDALALKNFFDAEFDILSCCLTLPMTIIFLNCQWDTMDLWVLTLIELETHGWEISTVSTDALALKHHAINIHSSDYIFHVFGTVSCRNITFIKNNITK